MTQALIISTEQIAVSPSRFPMTPDSMGNFSLPKELFIEIFKRLNNKDLANITIVNWTCKEVIERNTKWGEQKRFFRILPFLFKQGRFEETTDESDPVTGRALHTIHQTLTDTRNPTPELSQILTLYPNARMDGTGFRRVNNAVMMSYALETADRQRLTIIFPYEIDMQIPSPHLRKVEHYYLIDKGKKKLQKFTLGNPPTLVNELSCGQFTKSFEVKDFKGNRLLAWVGGFDTTDNDNPEKNFCTLQAINKDTLQTEISHHFYPFPETPLPNLVNNIYLDDKFCIVISNRSCTIKMGKSTIRIDQEILKPLLGMRIDHFSIQNRPDGQMEITLKGVKEGKKAIRMQLTMDPFYPTSTLPTPVPPLAVPSSTPTKLFLIAMAGLVATLGIVAYRHYTKA